jgi:hypothetical protein
MDKISGITLQPLVHLQVDPYLLIKKYETEIKDLKTELAILQSIHSPQVPHNSHHDVFTETARQEIMTNIKRYLKGEENIEVKNYSLLKEYFSQFRVLYQSTVSDYELKVKAHVSAISALQAQMNQLNAKATEEIPKEKTLQYCVTITLFLPI